MSPNPTPATILTIEDNPITRKMVRVALASDGYTILEAADGQTALRLTAQHVPDLILQDLLLPDVDGLELLRRLRALPGGDAVPIIALSGLLAQMEQAQSLQAGFTDYLFKPVEPSHLLATVRSYLRPRRTAVGRPGRGRFVLLADDDPLQRKLLRIQLEQLGFEVAAAADGAEALARAVARPPDAIISDVLMPRLDGFRLCLAVRRDERLATVPVLLTSAVYTEEADRRLARHVGANAFTLRTPDHREVTEALLACLESAARPAGPPAGPPAELPLEEYTHRVIRQLEHQVGLSAGLTRRLALLEAELGILARVVETLQQTPVIETVLEEMLHRCLDAAGISRGAAYLLEPDGRLALRARLGPAEPREGPDCPAHAALVRRALDLGEPVEASAAGPGGPCSLLLTPLLLGEERLGILEMASDSHELGEDWLAFAKAIGSQISQAVELARTLARLRDSEQRYRDLVEGVDAVVWEADAGRRQFTFVSRRAERLLGFPPDRWLAEPGFWAGRLHPADRERALALVRGPAGIRDHLLEYRLLTDGGGEVWVHDTVRVVPEDGQRPCRLRGVLVDISERKRSEEQEAQLRCARQIQQRLFPTHPPGLAGLDLAGASYPAVGTGGDYFDYVPVADGGLEVVIADVSGHGFGPALLMAECRAYLRALALAHTDIGMMAALLNRALAADFVTTESFVTLLLVRLDPASRSLAYVSAGHTEGYVLDAAGAVRTALPSLGPPLGVDADHPFSATPVAALAPGELLLMFTDGVAEARSPEGAAFGSARALDVVRACRREAAGAIIEQLYRAVRDFCRSRPPHDDVTMIVLKARAEP